MSIDRAGRVAATVAFTVLLATAGPADALPPDFQDELVLSGLSEPITIEFLPDQRLLILQKGGQMLISDPLAGLPAVAAPYMTITDVEAGGERGLIDIAIDPDFANNNWFYVYYHQGTGTRFRISRFTHLGDTADVSSEVLIWEDSNDSSSCCHYGGGLDFGPDGRLYLTTGEEFDGNQAQDVTRAGGSVIRVNKDGSVPTDNPFYDGAGPNHDAIWAIGLRNPFRAKWDLPTGRFFIAEVGGNNQASAYEDIHLGGAGKNFGWPSCEGPCDNPDFPSCNCLQHDDPIFGYAHGGNGASITGGIVYRGNQFPNAYDGVYFYADWVRQYIHYLTFDGSGQVVTGYVEFATGVPGVVDFTQGPLGALYYANLGGGEVRRIVYDNGNLGPTITMAEADVTQGPAPLTVNFSGAATDPEGDPITYEWLFGDGESAFGAAVTHEYDANGLYEAQLLASDAGHTAVSTPIIIEVGELPMATIVSPGDGAPFRAGETIMLSATGMDPDGVLVDGDFAWTVEFIHNEHLHPGPGPFIGPVASFDIPTTGHDFGDDTGYRITLTVTDADGLFDVQSVTIEPDKVDLTFDTAPSGQVVYVDDVPRTTPFVLDTLIDFQHVIRVDETFCDAGAEHTFDTWSDGGTLEHMITVPDANAALTATFAPSGECPTVLYRVNAGFIAVSQPDGDWEAYGPPYVNTGNNFQISDLIDMTHPSVPPGVPMVIFKSERTDPAAEPEMAWDFPVAAGTDVEVRLHFSELVHDANGERIFDVTLEGQLVLDDLDIYAVVGRRRALTYRFVLRSDGNIDIDFARGVENPKIAGVEIIQLATNTVACDGSEDDCNANGVPDPCETALADQALSFDGLDDWVDIPSVEQSGDFTIEAWVLLEGDISNADGIVGQEGLGQDINFFESRVRLYAPGDVIIANTATVPGAWTHYAITRSGSDLSLYIDGALDNTGVWSGVFAPEAIGRTNAGFTRGGIDEVRLWNVARSEAQIQSTMLRTVSSGAPGLVASWSFDEMASEQSVYDRAGGAAGTLGADAALAVDDPLRVASGAPVTSAIDADGNGVPDECEECPADFDGSGDVGFGDLTNLLGSWGPCVPKQACPDLDGDGSVGFTDLSQLLGAWGACP